MDEKTVVKVNMMSCNKRCNTHYDEELSCCIVEAPYKENAAVLFILPDEGKMKQEEEEDLWKETVSKWTKLLQQW